MEYAQGENHRATSRVRRWGVSLSPDRLSPRARPARLVRRLDPGCDAAGVHRRLTVLEIEVTDGRRLRHFQPTRKGDPDAPLTDAERDANFSELVAPVIGRPKTAGLLAAVRSVGDGAIDFRTDLPPATQTG